MDELEKWAKDKPKSLVMLAFTLAKASDSFHVILKGNNKTLYKASLTEGPSVKLWLKFYKDNIDGFIKRKNSFSRTC